MNRYFIKRKHESIAPEEILLEPKKEGAAEYERLEFAIPGFYIRAFMAVGLLGLTLLWGWAFFIQTDKRAIYTAQAEMNRRRLLFDQAPRGLIFDRYGEALAKNNETFDVTAVALNLPKGDPDISREADILSGITESPKKDIETELLGIRQKALAEPQMLMADIGIERATILKIHESELPGIRVEGKFDRIYPEGPAISHLLGYVGPDTSSKEMVGKTGMELAYDDVLRGESGKQAIDVNAGLAVIGTEKLSLPEPGKDLKLTIDAGLEEYLYRTLISNLSVYGYERAAAVAIQPKTGEVLAIASVPSFDNNSLARGISQKEYASLIADRAKPLFNRAISGVYSPGSTVKPMLAAAALQEKVISPNTLIDDNEGRIVVPNPYDPERPSVYRDWKAHGFVDMRRAIAESCDVYFYTVGGGYGNIKGLGIQRIDKYLELFGLGSSTNLGVGSEPRGLVPSPENKKETRPSDPVWRIGDTYITSIGQGDLLVTPLQLAMAYSAIANGGTLLKPRVVADPAASGPIVVRNGFVDPDNLKVVQEGMRLTVAAGSARSLSDLPFEVAGKTGTVEVGGTTETNAVFAAYAPYKDPAIVLVVIVEKGGEGSYSAVPIAKQVLLWYWQNRLSTS